MDAMRSSLFAEPRAATWYAGSDLGSVDDLAAEQPPSALFRLDTTDAINAVDAINAANTINTANTVNTTDAINTADTLTANLTDTPKPLSLYINTEDALKTTTTITPQRRRNTANGSPILSSSSSSSLLEDEMPPQSPLFATMPARAISEYHDSVQQLRKSRRNTMTTGPRKDEAGGLLEDEMPPASPFFADISSHDMDEYHESMRRLRCSRRNTMGGQRATWCAPEPVTGKFIVVYTIPTLA
ncbi:hypothetical protein IWW50_006524 [Coemansia erecta]|nr:hypothetical protein IWW50_006524 [Coemansia erecta]